MSGFGKLPKGYSQPNFSKSIGEFAGKLLTGHSIFIRGQPSAFSREIAPHFLFAEGVTLAPTLALMCTHTLTSWHAAPHAAQVSQMAREYAHRHEAFTNWTQHYTANRADLPNSGIRALSFFGAWMTLPPWVVVAGLTPSTAHHALATANGILAAKYETISSGMPSELRGVAAQYRAFEEYHKKAAESERTFGVIVALVVLWVVLPSALREAKSAQSQTPPGTAGWAQNYRPPAM